MSQLPPDEPPEDTLFQNGPGPNKKGVKGQGRGSTNDRNGGSHEPPTNRDLGLPENYNHEEHSQFIPSPVDLRNAAIDALDREYAFVILNHGEPKKIVARLDEIAAIALVASEITGDHQAKAVRLGLALELQYWLAADKLNDWKQLITTLLTVVLRIKNYELLSRVYESWGMYSAITGESHRADTALLTALECADDANREDIRLLMRAERYTIQASQMEVSEALAEATCILADARRLKYLYVQGRVYLSLADVYHRHLQYEQAFVYAQQALVFALREDDIGLQAQTTSTMLGVLMHQDDHSRSYCARLLSHLEILVRRSVNPWFQFMIEHQEAVYYYHQADHEQARKCALKAWSIARKVKVGLEGIRSEHMLGLIQSKRRCWLLAASHLNASYRWYWERKRIAASFDVRHALAYLLYEQGNLEGAVEQLKKLLVEIEDKLHGQARDRLEKNINYDLEMIQQELNSRLVSRS